MSIRILRDQHEEYRFINKSIYYFSIQIPFSSGKGKEKTLHFLRMKLDVVVHKISE